MTIWQPVLDEPTDASGGSPGGVHGAPRYLAIANAIARDVGSGKLPPGAQLPTHRDLADRLQVTVGTISRAYAEAKRRGLITGEVGRGTFVRQPLPSSFNLRPARPFGPRSIDERPRGPRQGAASTRDRSDGALGDLGDFIDLSFNAPAMREVIPAMIPALSALTGEAGLLDSARYCANIGSERHRRAGARWMAYAGLEADPDEVVVTAGAQHAMMLAFAVLTEPGDLVLTGSLTYPGMSALARLLRLRLQGVAMDEHGMRPDALAEACRRSAPRAIYVIPTIQNPTAVFMPAPRRQEIAEIARSHDIHIVEDDIYAHAMRQVPLPIAAFAPELSFRVDGLSKSVAPGLRIGFLRCPPSTRQSVAAALMATTIMASPITAEIASTIIEDGVAARIVDVRREQIAARQRLAREILGDAIAPHSRAESMHLWVRLPETWRAEELVARARERGVLVAASELFAVGHSVAPHAVRVSLLATEELPTLERGLIILRELMNSVPQPVLARI